MGASFQLIPYFLIGLITVILTISLLIWQRVKNAPGDSIDDPLTDLSSWLLLGLLLTAVFGLGAFVMYALLQVE